MFIDDYGLDLWTIATGKIRKADHFMEIRPQFVCADGFRVSIQASALHYSIPREDMCDHYAAFELGYPSAHDELLDEFVDWFGYDEKPDWTQSVYTFVPRDVVIRLINKHGGVGTQ